MHRAVGYLPAEPALFPRMTGRQHLDWLARGRGRGRGTNDLTLRDELVERFDAELDRPVRTLSKGNRQKIGLILVFFRRPDVLVLDEPTSGLDPLLQDEFDHLLRETVADGRTVFLSSHELDGCSGRPTECRSSRTADSCWSTRSRGDAAAHHARWSSGSTIPCKPTPSPS